MHRETRTRSNAALRPPATRTRGPGRGEGDEAARPVAIAQAGAASRDLGALMTAGGNQGMVQLEAAGAAPAAGRGRGSSATSAPAARRTVPIDIVALHGQGGAAEAQIEAAARLYAPHGIDIVVGTRRDLTQAESAAVLGGGTEQMQIVGNEDILNQGVPITRATDAGGRQPLQSEERLLLSYHQRPGILCGYWIPGSDSGAHAEALASYARVIEASQEGFVMTPAADGGTLAHEVGHLLTQQGHFEGDPNNLMDVDYVRNRGTNLTDEQAEAMRASPHAIDPDAIPSNPY